MQVPGAGDRGEAIPRLYDDLVGTGPSGQLHQREQVRGTCTG